NSRDVQKDRELLPATPLLQLRRYLEEQIVEGVFEQVEAPLVPYDPRYVVQREEGPPQDVLAQFGRLERGLGAATTADSDELSAKQRKDLEAWRRERARDFGQPFENGGTDNEAALSLARLRAFLLNPAKAFLERELHIDQEEDEADEEDDEPFYSGAPLR